MEDKNEKVIKTHIEQDKLKPVSGSLEIDEYTIVETENRTTFYGNGRMIEFYHPKKSIYLDGEFTIEQLKKAVGCVELVLHKKEITED